MGLFLSQNQATTASNVGTVAFRMADKPVVMDSSANEKHTNGMLELNRPTRNTRPQFFISAGSSPRSSTSGSKKATAIATRTAAVGSGSNSSVPMRMNKKDEPQMAASKTKSVSQALFFSATGATVTGRPRRTRPPA